MPSTRLCCALSEALTNDNSARMKPEIREACPSALAVSVGCLEEGRAQLYHELVL